MISSLHLESVATRFQPFVEELRPFLKQNDVAYGFPEHLLAFTEKLKSDSPLRAGVADKTAGLIQSAGEPVSHGEIVELLLVTVGGPKIDEDTPTVQKAERTLSQLVGEVMTSREGSLRVEAAPEPRATPGSKVAESTPAVGLHAASAAAEASPRVRTGAPAMTESSVSPLGKSPMNPMPAFDAVASGIAPEPELRPPHAIAWAPPPGFVWAALLCGVLLPPCMYLLSRPHAADLKMNAAAAPTHTAARPRPSTDVVLPTVVEWKPLDLDFMDDATAKKRPHVRVGPSAATHSTHQAGTQADATSGATGSEAPSPK